MLKKFKRTCFYLRHQLWSEFKYGEGVFGRFYLWLARHWNPVKPWFWKRAHKAIGFQLPQGYVEFVAAAYWTGEGWMLQWELEDDEGFSEYAGDVLGISDDEATMQEWPFFLPVATTKDLERAGFYIV